jgi:hypothetical protein
LKSFIEEEIYLIKIMGNPFEKIDTQLREIHDMIRNISALPPPNCIEIITQDELCKRLMISKPTIIRWAKKKKIPLIKIGRSVRFNWQSVIEALESKENKN